MTFINRLAVCTIALMVSSAAAIQDAAATQITLNFVQSSSALTWNGFFGGAPFLAQDGTAGTTDYDPNSPSNRTTYQGTITVDVDNLFAPTTIKLLSSAANADLSGKWLPEDYAFLPNDIDNDGNKYEFPDDASTSVGTTPGAAADADYGIRLRPTGAPANVAYATLHDMEFNISTAGYEAVNGLGEFSSLTQKFKYETGWWDYWLHPTFTAEKLRQRLEVAGGSNLNLSTSLSTYTVTPLGGGLSQVTLFIPVSVDDPDTTAPTSFIGQLVATAVIPEPASAALLGLAFVGLFTVRRRG